MTTNNYVQNKTTFALCKIKCHCFFRAGLLSAQFAQFAHSSYKDTNKDILNTQNNKYPEPS